MCIVIICFRVCNVKNLEVNLSLSSFIKPFSFISTNVRTKTEKSSGQKVGKKAFVINYDISVARNDFRPESECSFNITKFQTCFEANYKCVICATISWIQYLFYSYLVSHLMFVFVSIFLLLFLIWF